MKYFIITILLVSWKASFSQNLIKVFDEDWNPIDTIEKIYQGKISDDSLEYLENNELEKQVKDFTIGLIKQGIVTYPYDELRYELYSTYKMLLLEMQIDFNDYVKKEIDVTRPHYAIYYNMMLNYFDTMYGKGFFDRIKLKADSLDKINFGLKLPKIKNVANTDLTITELISNTFLKIKNEDKIDNLYLSFRVNKNNKIAEIKINSMAWHGLYEIEELTNKYSSEILLKLDSVKWEYATFKNAFIDKNILFEVNKSEMTFYPF